MRTSRTMASVKVQPARMRTTLAFVLTAIHNNAADSISQPMVIQCESSLSGMATVMNAIAIETCSIWITMVAGVGAAERYLNKLPNKRKKAERRGAYPVRGSFGDSYIATGQRKRPAALTKGSSVRVSDGPLYKRD